MLSGGSAQIIAILHRGGHWILLQYFMGGSWFITMLHREGGGVFLGPQILCVYCDIWTALITFTTSAPYNSGHQIWITAIWAWRQKNTRVGMQILQKVLLLLGLWPSAPLSLVQLSPQHPQPLPSSLSSHYHFLVVHFEFSGVYRQFPGDTKRKRGRDLLGSILLTLFTFVGVIIINILLFSELWTSNECWDRTYCNSNSNPTFKQYRSN